MEKIKISLEIDDKVLSDQTTINNREELETFMVMFSSYMEEIFPKDKNQKLKLKV